MAKPEVVSDHTGAFYGAAVAFLLVTGIWNAANILLSGMAVQQQWNVAMGIVSAMFAVVVVSKVIRDRQESQKLVNGIRQARYEEMLANAPAPGLGHL
ncbi:hypothetical protein FDO65_03395 [Nakamurella flava]|uniref:YiaAB two helix domain-containing protein n=1 Tax=Nakamurella flava TaxID=2576308 RepID=A0A4U6QJS7_9ACTN|nr:hypothetical protein [Nakamurella flava]TKV60737.1 hypothetical protein FDO65_03395 [Nakamurella flava]